MSYRQLTSGERYMLAALRKQGLNQAQIGRALGRHRSTISRELCRNSSRLRAHYRPSKTQERTNGRRSRSRRNLRFSTQRNKHPSRRMESKLIPLQDCRQCFG
jgi:transposase, IS30 family